MSDRRDATSLFVGIFFSLMWCSRAFAHASDRGHVLLLPTHYYLFGGMLAVALSFLVLVFLPPEGLLRLSSQRLPIARIRFDGRGFVSCLSALFLAGLIYTGFAGSRDPLSNPLPLTVWTLLWVGLTLFQGLAGNIWAWLNPWYGPWRLILRLGVPSRGFLRLPRAIGMIPAVLLLFAFAWFELIYPAPDDPARLAIAVLTYWVFSMLGAVIFGYHGWSRRVEFLTIFFTMISRLSLFSLRRETGRSRVLFVGVPGHKLRDTAALPLSGILFLLLALSSVSFDGFMRTFLWLGAIGVNPLEFPGRSAVVLPNTIGLLSMFAALCTAFLLAVRAGNALAGGEPPRRAAGHLVWSIIPIALAYHFSHYLVAFAINSQYALSAHSDPLMQGWDLFGTADMYVQAGVALGAESAWKIWNAQAFAIIGGHVFAIIVAHMIAHRLYGGRRRAGLSQIPLAVLMVLYTVFGLWLLSAPTGG
ncbi:hypothetical protein RDZ08_09250 [Nitratireductor indicus]|nr:hypothetical protein [Nitratireductor indicus]MDS1136371.1 hypothetical protein [Nitratireductor indicus]